MKRKAKEYIHKFMRPISTSICQRIEQVRNMNLTSINLIKTTILSTSRTAQLILMRTNQGREIDSSTNRKILYKGNSVIWKRINPHPCLEL
jgi:hypothetical protein